MSGRRGSFTRRAAVIIVVFAGVSIVHYFMFASGRPAAPTIARFSGPVNTKLVTMGLKDNAGTGGAYCALRIAEAGELAETYKYYLRRNYDNGKELAAEFAEHIDPAVTAPQYAPRGEPLDVALEPGEKLVSFSWSGPELHAVTRAAQPGEKFFTLGIYRIGDDKPISYIIERAPAQ